MPTRIAGHARNRALKHSHRDLYRNTLGPLSHCLSYSHSLLHRCVRIPAVCEHTGRFFGKMIAASFGHYIPQLRASNAPVLYQAMPMTLLANTATLLQAKLSTRVSLASPTARSHILCWFHRRTVKGRRGGARWLTGPPTRGRAAPPGGGWGEVSPPQASSSDAFAAARRC